MSHFVTAVFVPTHIATHHSLLERHLEEKLAPYDANHLVDEYDRDCHCIGSVARKEAKERANAEFGTIASLRDSFAALVLTDGRCVGNMQNSYYEKIRNREASMVEQAGCLAIGKELENLWSSHLQPRSDAEKRYLREHPLHGAPDPNCGFYSGEREDWWPEEAKDGDSCGEGSGCQGTGTYRSTENPDYKWDWWVIGGNWNGWLAPPEAQPEKDPDNWKPCSFCAGTGTEPAAPGTCCLCDGTGKELVHPAEQKDSGYNIVAPKYIIALGLLGELPTPLAFVDPLGHWHEHDDELDEESWRAEWRAALTQVCNGIAGFRVVVVDMHI